MRWCQLRDSWRWSKALRSACSHSARGAALQHNDWQLGCGPQCGERRPAARALEDTRTSVRAPERTEDAA
ncbi:hypothetical protein AAFF_G00021140 [Aldrovandia affinis]|uniref:Uncharacterized protein n=1 Tax=Aldrovandia affinis TaxID=143900 RepID=A0AAD7S5R5_9TELE|nr:hypothetical protein AAFF_G00021140 [Aldrovandia affinis]